jgi:ankyrin repeat protein
MMILFDMQVESALHIASGDGHLNIVKVLVEAGADVAEKHVRELGTQDEPTGMCRDCRPAYV